VKYRLRVNRADREVDVPRGTTLLEVLRDDLGLTGTRYGCGRGQCGACYVLADSGRGPRAVASCLLAVDQAAAVEITTIEGLTRDGKPTAVQDAFVAEDAMQCGYCTSGMVISATALLRALRLAEARARVVHRPYRGMHGFRRAVAGDVPARCVPLSRTPASLLAGGLG